MIKFNCPRCQQRIEADESQSGIVASCPSCRESIEIPHPEKIVARRQNRQPAIPEKSPFRKFFDSLAEVLAVLFLVGVGIFAISAADIGYSNLTQATYGAGMVGVGCFVLILVRLWQASLYQSRQAQFNKELLAYLKHLSEKP